MKRFPGLFPDNNNEGANVLCLQEKPSYLSTEEVNQAHSQSLSSSHPTWQRGWRYMGAYTCMAQKVSQTL